MPTSIDIYINTQSQHSTLDQRSLTLDAGSGSFGRSIEPAWLGLGKGIPSLEIHGGGSSKKGEKRRKWMRA
jgi:hypothetical protein